jgi:DNA-binding CsgD family transcriptional regulator
MDEDRVLALDRLSDRQRQCLGLVADGYTSKEIGRQLSLSPSTIDSHVRSALTVLNMSDRIVASRFLRESQKSGFIEMPTTHAGDRSLFRLPPLGGSVNNLSARRRIWHIVQIALIGIMGMTAAVITIAGLVNLFSGR